MKQRLQKLISCAGISSRRKAEILLKQGRVKLNGKTASIGDSADPDIDEIIVDGTLLLLDVPSRVILLNKPSGVISTCSDTDGRKTVIDLLPSNLRKGLHPVGRLDQESRGAILLSNNGELTLKLTHPKYAHSKAYRVWIKGIPSKNTIKKWQEGIMLDGKKTMPAKFKLINISKNKSLLDIILKEGRNRQIRRMTERLGHPVIDLKRTSIADISLKDLKEGQWRILIKEDWINLI